MARLLAGESTRKYSNTVGANGQGAVCTSKSEVSRRFIKEMDKLMEEFFTRPLDDDYPVIILDGLELGKITILAAMGINREGQKRMLGIIEGGSENSIVVKDLLNDLIERGLDFSRPRLYVLDGSKALHKGVEAQEGHSLTKLQKQLSKLDLLTLDDLSYLSFSKQQSELLFQVISDRSERSSLIISTNLEFSKWVDFFGDPMLTAALVDQFYVDDHNGSFSTRDACFVLTLV